MGFMNPFIPVSPGSTMEVVLIQSCRLALAVHADQFNWEMLSSGCTGLGECHICYADLLQLAGIGLASGSDSLVTSGCAVPSESASGHRQRAHHWISHYFLCGFAAVLWDNGLMCPLCPSC